MGKNVIFGGIYKGVLWVVNIVGDFGGVCISLGGLGCDNKIDINM